MRARANREVSDKYKGFRLQKLRLILRMFLLLKDDSTRKIIGAIEYKDDVYIQDNQNNELLEQNKEYTNDFSFNNDEIIKSIINFLDNYLESERDNQMFFCFYTNVNYRKEYKAGVLREISLTPLEKPILYYLENNIYNDNVISIIKKVIIYKYNKQYATGSTDEFFEEIKSFTNNDWIRFLEKVKFEFGEPNSIELEDKVIAEIKGSDFYDISHIGKEDIIKRYLLDIIDEKMCKSNPFQKIIQSEQIELIFYKVLDEVDNKKIDPVHSAWKNGIDKLSENIYRNIEEKIIAVSPDFPKKSINRLKVEATICIAELNELDSRIANSLKVRVYNAMSKYFDEKFEYKDEYSSFQLKKEINNIKEEAKEYIKRLKDDYNYGLNNDDIIENLVSSLINECYHCFERE